MKYLFRKLNISFVTLLTSTYIFILCGCSQNTGPQNTGPIDIDDRMIMETAFWYNDADDYFIPDSYPKERFKNDYRDKIDIFLNIKAIGDSLSLSRVLFVPIDNNSYQTTIISFKSSITQRTNKSNKLVSYNLESNQFPYEWFLDSRTNIVQYKIGNFKGTIVLEIVDFFGKDCYQLRINGSLTKSNNKMVNINFTYSTCHLYD